MRLLTLATLRLPDLYLCGACWRRRRGPQVEPVPPLVTSRLARCPPGAAARAPRAGDPRARARLPVRARGVERARATHAQLSGGLQREERPLVDQTRRCAIALTRAIAATAAEAVLVPGELADALARLLALYLIATTLR